MVDFPRGRENTGNRPSARDRTAFTTDQRRKHHHGQVTFYCHDVAFPPDLHKRRNSRTMVAANSVIPHSSISHSSAAKFTRERYEDIWSVVSTTAQTWSGQTPYDGIARHGGTARRISKRSHYAPESNGRQQCSDTGCLGP